MSVKLHIDLETLQLIQGPGLRSAVNSLRFKRGDAARLQVVFLENGISPVPIGDPDALEIQFGIKPRNQFDHSYLAHSTDWSMPANGDDTPTYECELSLNTLQLNSALNIGSATVDELPEITLMGEITWREGMSEPTSTRTFLVVVENDVNRGTEGEPSDANPGNITLTGTIAASNLSGTNTGDQDLSGLAPIDHTHVVADLVSVASQRLIGRHTSGNGAAQEIQATGGIEFSGGTIRRSALTGDVTASAGSNATTIANDTVSNAKLANMATATIKGRTTAGTGDPEDLTAADALALIGAATPASVSAQIAVGFTLVPEATINFANSSRLREGMTDAGNGGAGGIAMVCSLDYEFKWEAGRLYVMGQDGFTIRVEQYGFTTVPTATDDETKGYVVGSTRILDDGTAYVCTDATAGAASWQVEGFMTSGAAAYFPKGIFVEEGYSVDNAYDVSASNGFFGGDLTTPAAAPFPLGLSFPSAEGLYWYSVGYGGAYISAAGGEGGSSITMGNVDNIGMNSILSANAGIQINGGIGSTGIDMNNYVINGIAAIGAYGGSDCYLPTSGGNLLTDATGVSYTGASANLDLGSNGLEALTVNTANGYTTQGGSAYFPYGFYVGADVNIYGWDLEGANNVYAYVGYYGGTKSSPAAAIFPSGFDAGSNSGVVGSLLTGTDLSQALSVDNRQLIGSDGIPRAGWNNYGLNFGWDGSSGFYHTLDGNGINTPEGLVVDLGYKQLKTSGGASLDWANRQLLGTDGTTVVAAWNNNGAPNFPQGIDSVGSGYIMSGQGFVGYNGNPSEATFPNGLACNTMQGLSQGDVDFLYGVNAAYGFKSNGGAAYFPFGATMADNLVMGGQPIDDAHSIAVDAITNRMVTGAPAFTYGASYTPTAAASLAGTVEGSINYVNDADAPVIGSAVTGGGSAKCLVCYNGTDWIVTALL